METYELTLVLPEGTTTAKKKETTKNLESLLKVMKGKVENMDDWGEVELANPINKNNKAVFLSYKLAIPPSEVNQVKQKLDLEESYLKLLLVKE